LANLSKFFNEQKEQKNYFSAINDQVNDNNVTNVVAYEEASAPYADGTGGSPATVSVAATAVAAELLEGAYSIEILKAATDGSGEGVSLVTSTIDRQDYGRTLWGSIEGDFTEMVTSGDWSLYAYDVTNAAILPVVMNDADDVTIANKQGKLQFSVFPASTTASIRLSLHLESDSDTASAYSLYIDDIKLGPQASMPGYVSEPAQDFTPTWAVGTFTLGDGTVNYANYTRDGNWMTGVVRITFGSTTTMGSAPKMDIPNSLTVDTAVWPVVTNMIAGGGSIRDSGTGVHQARVQAISSTQVLIQYINSSAAATAISSTAPMTWTTNDEIEFSFRIPISGWKASNLISTQEALFSVPKSYTSNVTPTGTLTGTLSTAIFGTLENNDLGLYDTTTGIWTASRNGDVDVAAGLWYNYESATNRSVRVAVKNIDTGKYVYANNRSVGASTSAQVNVSGTLEVTKGDRLVVQSYCDGTSPTFASILSHFSFAYRPDFSVFGVQGETELVESTTDAQATWPFAASTPGNLTSITLTPGEWDLTAYLGIRNSAVGAAYFVDLLMTPTSASISGIKYADNASYVRNNGAQFDAYHMTIPRLNVTVTETTTYYLVGNMSANTGVQYKGYKISARRIK